MVLLVLQKREHKTRQRDECERLEKICLFGWQKKRESNKEEGKAHKNKIYLDEERFVESCDFYLKCSHNTLLLKNNNKYILYYIIKD